jgi:FKBP-type peptidyl-prolyl cis-trans isomerase (trigger factor)
MSSIQLRISVPFSELDSHIKKAYAKASSRLNVAGFRKGKIPERMIDLRIGRNQILHDAIAMAIPDFFEKALIEKSLFVIGNPSFRVNEFKDGENLEFETQISVRPAITLPEFSKIELQVPNIQISEADLDSRLEAVLSSLDEKNTLGIDPGNIQERMSDDFVKTFTSFETVEALRDKLYEGLQVEKKIQQGSLARDLLITKLINELEIPLPEDLIEKEVADHLSREPEHDTETHKIEVENEIRLSLKTDYLLDVVSRANRIEINDSEINDYLVKAAQRFSLSPQDLFTQLEKAGQVQPLMAEVARSKALALVLSQVSIVDSDGQVIHL